MVGIPCHANQLFNNGFFDTNSTMIHPNDRISVAVECCFDPNKSSGALKRDKQYD